MSDSKIAKLKPNKGSKIAPKSYRPMSLLPLVFKHQTQSFLDKYDIIYKFHSGFRKCFSTYSCLFYLNNKIAAGFESGFYTGMILIDLQKAFNTHFSVIYK